MTDSQLREMADAYALKKQTHREANRIFSESPNDDDVGDAYFDGAKAVLAERDARAEDNKAILYEMGDTHVYLFEQNENLKRQVECLREGLNKCWTDREVGFADWAFEVHTAAREALAAAEAIEKEGEKG